MHVIHQNEIRGGSNTKIQNIEHTELRTFRT